MNLNRLTVWNYCTGSNNFWINKLALSRSVFSFVSRGSRQHLQSLLTTCVIRYAGRGTASSRTTFLAVTLSRCSFCRIYCIIWRPVRQMGTIFLSTWSSNVDLTYRLPNLRVSNSRFSNRCVPLVSALHHCLALRQKFKIRLQQAFSPFWTA